MATTSVAMSLLDLIEREFLTEDRVRAWQRVIVACFCVLSIAYLAMSRTGLDPFGKALGTDYTSFYAASKLALAGHPDAAYRMADHAAAQVAIFGQDIGYAAFFYPPVYLLYCLPLGLLPYLWSLCLWQGLTLAFFARTVRAIAGQSLGWSAILFFPAVFLTLGHGQNAFLSAGLFGAGILCLDRRPIVAGICFGCLCYKPQLGIVIPFVLVAARRWTAIASAAGTVLCLAAITTAVFGVDIWRAFLDNAPVAVAALENSLVEPFKMQSAYAAVRVLGGSSQTAYLVQAVFALAALSAVVWVTAKAPPDAPTTPLMVVAALLATPFLLDYELLLLALPLAWLWAESRTTGFYPGERLVAVAIYLLPLIARPLGSGLHIVLGPFLISALLFVLVRRVTGTEGARAHAAAPPALLSSVTC
jgi:alpha-1,2-mannosyltransferase